MTSSDFERLITQMVVAGIASAYPFKSDDGKEGMMHVVFTVKKERALTQIDRFLPKATLVSIVLPEEGEDKVKLVYHIKVDI